MNSHTVLVCPLLFIALMQKILKEFVYIDTIC